MRLGGSVGTLLLAGQWQGFSCLATNQMSQDVSILDTQSQKLLANIADTGQAHHRVRRFSQFKEVKLGAVWNDLKSSKIVSYTVTRDLTVFLFVQMMWITLHLFLWKGSLTENRRTGDLFFDDVTDRNVDMDKIMTFFMDPKNVARNLFVCTSFFFVTATFWLIPSFFWKYSHLSEREDTKRNDLLDTVQNSLTAADNALSADDRTSGIVNALVTRGPGDLYNRVLCPTCILQIIFINTLLFSAQLLFWSIVTILPDAAT